MLGLAYDTGRARVITSEAAAVLATVENPGDPRTLLQLLLEGQAALDENRALDSIALFTKVVLLNPELAENYVPLGRALQAFNLESQATAAWEAGHALDAEHAQLCFHVADMAYRQGDRNRAKRLFERAVEFDPKHAASWGRLARLSYFDESDDKAWSAIQRAEDLGETIPAVMRARLAARSPDPLR
mgnify:FL=1